MEDAEFRRITLQEAQALRGHIFYARSVELTSPSLATG